jgi:hypothetical protein
MYASQVGSEGNQDLIGVAYSSMRVEIDETKIQYIGPIAQNNAIAQNR